MPTPSTGNALAAERRRAFLAGQNAVAMGASSAVDAIEGLVPIVGRPTRGSALWRLADGWKAQLSESTAAEATYLQVALLEWERGSQPSPGSDDARRGPRAGGRGHDAALGTPSWPAARRPGWSGPARTGPCRSLRRPWNTSLEPPSACASVSTRSRFPRTLRRGWPESSRGRSSTSSSPPWSSERVFPSFGEVPLPAIGMGVSLCLVAGWWSHRRLVRDGPRGGTAVFCGAVVVALALTVLADVTARQHFSADGDVLLQFGSGTLLLAFYGGTYHAGARPPVVVGSRRGHRRCRHGDRPEPRRRRHAGTRVWPGLEPHALRSVPAPEPGHGARRRPARGRRPERRYRGDGVGVRGGSDDPSWS